MSNTTLRNGKLNEYVVSKLNQLNILTFSHFFVNIFGLIGLAKCAGIYVGKTYSTKYFGQIDYNTWSSLVTTSGKTEQIFVYIVTIVCLFLYFGLAYLQLHGYFSFRNRWFSGNKRFFGDIIGFLSFTLLINLLLLFSSLHANSHFQIASMAAWVGLLSFPYIRYQPSQQMVKTTGYIFLFILLAVLWASFIPNIFHRTQLISNDYADIDEKTKLGGNRYVDNSAFINQHRIGGMLRNQIHQGKQVQFVPDLDYIDVSRTAALNIYVQSHKNIFHYASQEKGLFVDGKISDEIKNSLCTVLNGDNACTHVTNFMRANAVREKYKYSPEELDFFKKNLFEFTSQFRPGSYFHHHNAFLGPINAYALGKPADQIIFFYGWLSTLVVAFLMKLLGGLSFGNYLSVTYFIYPLYYTLLAGSAQIIFRNIWYTLLMTVSSLASLYLISFEAIRIAPGFNPIRHIFDLFIIVLLYQYFSWNSKSRTRLFFITSFTILSYLMNKEFGLIILFSVVISLLAKMFGDRSLRINEVVVVSFLLLIAFITPHLIVLGSNPLSIYNLSGVFIPFTRFSTIVSVIAFTTIMYFVIIFTPWKKKSYQYFLLFLFCYGQGTILYYIWNPSPTHLYSIIFPWLFILIMMLRQILSAASLPASYKRLPIALFFIVFLFAYLPACITYLKDMKDYNRVFANHFIYQWNLPTAPFKSTMDPTAFNEAVLLINKYEKTNGIFMLSKYENILPFLSGKYNTMPYLQTDLSLVTPTENTSVIDLILTAKPAYIFVDSDIERNHHGDAFSAYDTLSSFANYDEGHVRELMLENFGRMFAEIKPFYRLVEHGTLISVYQRVGKK